jgi:hypothetical protein
MDRQQNQKRVTNSKPIPHIPLPFKEVIADVLKVNPPKRRKLINSSNGSTEIVEEETMARLLSLLLLLCGLSGSSSAQIQTHQPSPRVVSQISRVNLTGSQPQRHVFTPQKDGLFRLSIYVVSTAGSGKGNILFQGFYTDDAGQAEYSVTLGGQVGCNTGAICSWTFVLRAKAGTPITWGTNLSPDCDSTYNVYATLEKLQHLQ